jgi:hypothetical protein
VIAQSPDEVTETRAFFGQCAEPAAELRLPLRGPLK